MSIENSSCCSSSIGGVFDTTFTGTNVTTDDLFAINARITNYTGTYIDCVNISGTQVNMNRSHCHNITGFNLRYQSITGIDATMTNLSAGVVSGTNFFVDPGVFRATLGSQFAPVFTFASNIDSGMYATASEVKIAESATDIIGCTSSQLNVYKPLRGNNNQPYSKYAQNVLNGGSLTAATINKVLFPGLISPTQNNPVTYSSGDFTIQYTGIYYIHFQMQSSETVSGIRDFYITLNDNVPTNAGTISRLRLDGQVGGIKVLTWIGKLSVNDVIRCWYFTTQNNNYGDTTMPRPEVSFYLLS